MHLRRPYVSLTCWKQRINEFKKLRRDLMIFYTTSMQENSMYNFVDEVDAIRDMPVGSELYFWHNRVYTSSYKTFQLFSCEVERMRETKHEYLRPNLCDMFVVKRTEKQFRLFQIDC